MLIIPTGRYCSRVLFTPGGNSLMVAGGAWDKEEGFPIVEYATKDGAMLRRFFGATDQVDCLALHMAGSPDSHRLAAGQCWRDGSLRLWDMCTAQQKPQFWPDRNVKPSASKRSPRCWDVAFSSDGRYVASVWSHGNTGLCVWNTDTGSCVLRDQNIYKLDSLTPKGSVVFTGETSFVTGGSEIIWWEDFKPKYKIGDIPNLSGSDIYSRGIFQESTVGSLDYDPGSGCLAAAVNGENNGYRPAVVVFRKEFIGWSLQTVAMGHKQEINQVVFLRDGRHVASCSRDRSVRVWDALTGACCGSTRPDPTEWKFSDGIVSMAVSSDGAQMATVENGNIRILDPREFAMELTQGDVHVSRDFQGMLNAQVFADMYGADPNRAECAARLLVNSKVRDECIISAAAESATWSNHVLRYASNIRDRRVELAAAGLAMERSRR